MPSPKRHLLIAALILSLALVSVAGAEDDADDVVDRLQSFYEKLDSYKADFVQKAVKSMVNRTFVNEGTLWFKKPAMMRWDYNKPQNQLVIINDENIWFYKPAKKEATFAKTESVFGSELPVTFLAGVGKIKDSFDYSLTRLGDVDSDKMAVLKLKPKKEQTQFTRILLIVEKASGRIAEVRLYDYMENENSITFTNIDTNVKIPESKFKFTPPPGTKVVTPTAEGATVPAAGPQQKPVPIEGGP